MASTDKVVDVIAGAIAEFRALDAYKTAEEIIKDLRTAGYEIERKQAK